MIIPKFLCFFFFGGEGGVFVCVHQEMLISFFSFLSSLAMQTEKKKKLQAEQERNNLQAKRTRKAIRVNSSTAMVSK